MKCKGYSVEEGLDLNHGNPGGRHDFRGRFHLLGEVMRGS